jgi:hypothetical protein
MQTLLVALIVAAALVYAGRRAWTTIASARAKKAGGGCEDCH